MDAAAPLSRIALRVLYGFLAGRGYSIDPAIATDPDIQQLAYFLIAGGLGLFCEGWYFLARKYGWGR